MPLTRKMPAFQVQKQWRKDAERDARALILAAKLGCSFPEAVAAIMDEPPYPHLSVLKRTPDAVH